MEGVVSIYDDMSDMENGVGDMKDLCEYIACGFNLFPTMGSGLKKFIELCDSDSIYPIGCFEKLCSKLSYISFSE